MNDPVFAFLLACVLIELTPGPNMTYLAIVSASEGRRYGLITTLGVMVGLSVIGMLAAFGLAALVQTTPEIYQGLRWAGIAYLLYLAWDGWRDAAQVHPDGPERHNSPQTYFMRGLITNLLNPKAALFYVTVLPTFLAQPVIRREFLLFVALYVAIATLIHLLIVGFAGFLKRFLDSQAREKTARRVLSLLLAGVAIWFAVET